MPASYLPVTDVGSAAIDPPPAVVSVSMNCGGPAVVNAPKTSGCPPMSMVFTTGAFVDGSSTDGSNTDTVPASSLAT